MKSILISIKPKWCAKIMNGDKTIEVRKKFPKDYVGWVYLYCSKKDGFTGKIRDGVDCYDGELYKYNFDKGHKVKEKKGLFYDGETLINSINGKVVARFWCDKVEEILNYGLARRSEIMMEDLLKKSCLTMRQLNKYAPHKEYKDDDYIYAIHISKLEIFNKPKELSEFWNCGKQVRKGVFNYSIIHKAPINYCYIEGE